jgi:hypothetical protein
MVVIKKAADGEYYLFRRKGPDPKKQRQAKRNCNYLLLERVFLGEVVVPEELQGKRVRFKVEEVK